MIEAEVHHQLRAFLREQGDPRWPHHLTLARLVARALRLGRSALMQVGSASAYNGRYRLSYLISTLMWPGPVILVAPEQVLQQLLVDLTRLRDWLPTYKSIQRADRWPDPNYQGLLMTTPEAWLSDRLGPQIQFPPAPTLVDGVDDLESWVQSQLTVSLTESDWEALALAYPEQQEFIREIRVRLAHAAFSHPPNPYKCHLLETEQLGWLQNLRQELIENHPDRVVAQAAMPIAWNRFWARLHPPDHLLWAALNRDEGQFRICCAPVEVASLLKPLWSQQPVVLIGAAVDSEAKATTYRQRLGLEGDMTCLKFGPDRHNEMIPLYLPDHLPLPNTPQFQAAIYSEIRSLLSLQHASIGPAVLLIEDNPLRSQLAARLAGEFGTRVRVEQLEITNTSILVCSWRFWQVNQNALPAPGLLIVATLPLPSLENPLVAGRVAYHKRLRQDWFRLYLLPTALNELQRAIASAREHQSIVALLDTRVHYRSYGQAFRDALNPSAQVRSLEQAKLLASDYAY